MNYTKELRAELVLTQEQLAALSETSRHAVMRMEQLCYPTPLPNIVTTLSELTGLSEEQIQVQYTKDVILNRLTTARALRPHHNFLVSMGTKLAQLPLSEINIHPFTIWRHAVTSLLGVSNSQIHFSIMTSIHPATLSKYEVFKTGFPMAIEVALTQCELPSDLINLFNTSPAFNLVR